jgi:hypothetical protein
LCRDCACLRTALIVSVADFIASRCSAPSSPSFESPPALMRTLRYAPSAAARALRTAQPASLSELGLPFSITVSAAVRAREQAVKTESGTSIASLLAAKIARSRAAISSSVAFGRRRASMILLNACVSASIATANFALSACASLAVSSSFFFCFSKPFSRT